MPIKSILAHRPRLMIYSQQGLKPAPEIVLGGSVSFNLYTTDHGESFIMNKHMLACFFDMPLNCAAKLLGMHRNSLSRLKGRLGVDKWPYVDVLRGNNFGFSKEDIVRSRECLIADMENELELCDDSSVQYSLKVLRVAAEKAKLFWGMAGMGEDVDMEDEMPVQERKTAAAKKRKVLHKKPKKVDPSSTSTSVVPAKEPERKEESEAETLPVFWPIITEQFNFDPLFEVDAVEDELQLGPLKA